MGNKESSKKKTENVNNDVTIIPTIDIIKELTDFVFYLNTNDDCQMLLKPSKIELQNEIKFAQRAEKILKHHHRHDQIIIEEKIINELQQNIRTITKDLNNKIDNEILEPKNIAEIYDKVMSLKIMDSRNVKLLENFIKLNKICLKDINSTEKEIKTLLDKLSPKTKLSKKSEVKITCTTNTSRGGGSPMSFAQRNDENASHRIHPITYTEHARQFGNTTNENIVNESQTYINELLRMTLENDQTRVMENFINRSYIDQNTRYRYNEDLLSTDVLISNVDDDLVEFSSLNSTVNLYKDNEDNKSGDIHLILQAVGLTTESINI